MRILRKLLGKYFSFFAIMALSTIRPPRSRKYDVWSFCNTCSAPSKFYFNPWVINSKTLSAWKNLKFCEKMLLRESLFCRKCATSARVRALVQAFLQDYLINNSNSLGVTELAIQKNFSILGINRIGNSRYLFDLFDQKFNYTETTYEPESEFGTIFNNRQNENILDLTFKENTFDFIFHSDVLEHVPDWETALSECFRVLKPNGKILFTTPIHDYRRETDKRFIRIGTKIHSTGVEIYHGKAGGIFSMIPVQNDFLEMYQFGINFEIELKKKFHVVEKMEFILGNSNHLTEVFMITKSNFMNK